MVGCAESFYCQTQPCVEVRFDNFMDFLLDVRNIDLKVKDIFLIPYGAVLSTMKH